MKLEILSLPLPPVGASLGDDAVTEAIGPARVESFESHVVHTSGGARLVLVLGLADGQGRKPTPRPEADLGDDDRHVFDQLRAWRNTYAQARGMAPYLVISNGALAAVAAARPQSVDDLLAVRGIGEAKAALYGAELLARLATLEADLATARGALDPANDPASEPDGDAATA